MAKTYRKAVAQMPQREVLLVMVWDGEKSIYRFKGSEAQIAQELKRDTVREFIPGADDRGAEVKILNTFGGKKESSWFPETQGSYVIRFIPGLERPKELAGHQLHFGSMSSPQRSKACVARVYRDIIDATPGLAPYLECGKIAAIFTCDHPDVPGGSFVPVSIESLPEPAPRDHVARFYM